MSNAMSIAIMASNVPDYTSVAELAKAACMVTDWRAPYDRVIIAGIDMFAWQAKIAEANFMVLLSVQS